MTKTVLITGGSRGIGEAMVRLFAERGWTVVFTFVSNPEAAFKVAKEAKAHAVRCDSGSEEDILSLFESLDGEGTVLDALINNAGVSGPRRRAVEVTREILEEVTRVNFIGPVLFCREAVKRMSTASGGRGGAIVNLSSTATKKGGAGQWADYAALKGAIDVFTNGLAREVGTEGIRVNAVAPGYVLTDMAVEGGIAQRFEEALKSDIPMGRIGDVREIAEAAYWLCSDAAGYVTGTVLNVAGGR
ncbi:MAG: NAD(P)-dependent oxidoreductase [Rhodospirillales bacterium CG15_BIG_FIL_POST_REV_8_21_14_020_66_15]|nr:MAG: NAD(P)-dependent oxidoreductase [Rhodospirillales bacterium CG15_BIG_FIL_POST_REV_8_21_14_020_66_15]